MPVDGMKHYLKIEKSGQDYRWVCACGTAEGTGPTELACEISHDRHIMRVRRQLRAAVRRAIFGP